MKKDNLKNIKHVRKTYYRTRSGKSWSKAKKNIDVVTQFVDLDFFNSFTSEDNINFFGDRVNRSYEKVGYVPTTLTNINPDGSKKTVNTFEFMD